MTGKTIGRNLNTFDTTTTTIYTLNSVTATKIADSDLDRILFTAVIQPNALTSSVVHIRYYAAATDNTKQGVDILTKKSLGNKSLLNDTHVMHHDNIYTGEISAITEVGTFDITVTEG